MRPEYVMSFGRIGKLTAEAIASSGRIGKNVLILFIPVEYTPYTIVTVEPNFYGQTILAKEFVVRIVENRRSELEVIAGYLYVIELDRRFEFDIVDFENYVTISDVRRFEVDSIESPYSVEVLV